MDIIDRSLDTGEDKDVESQMLGKKLVTPQSLTIVEDEGSLSPDESGPIQQALIDNGDEGIEEGIAYHLRSAEGDDPVSVTYRVVSVGSELPDGIPQIVSTNGTTFSNSSSQSQGVQALLTNSVNGQLYVIGSTDEVFGQQNQRNIMPVMESVRSSGTSSPQCRPRDDRRRATHNEVERRRRDKINNWIMKLSKIIPECASETGKASFETQSKGGILAKACDYIMELRTNNQRLQTLNKDSDHIAEEMENMARQIEELRNENQQLRAQMADHGITPCLDPLSILP